MCMKSNSGRNALSFSLSLSLSLSLFFFFFFVGLGAAHAAYRGFQGRGPVRTVATGLHHSHSNNQIRPTPQLTATPDP